MLIIRGEYLKMTLCIYGDIITESEMPIAAPLYNKDVQLTNLKEYMDLQMRIME